MNRKHALQGAIATVLSLGMSLSALATEYTTVQPEHSTVGFSYHQMGVAMDGHFQRFAAQLSFDPAKPAAAKLAFDVDLASIDVGSSDGNEEVAGKLWFNTKAFPTAHFVASSVKPLGANRYQVSGRLSIKGRAQDISLPATLTPQGNAAAFDGSFQIHRADFAIGEGEWADFSTVANEIAIKFHILAAAGK